MMPHELTRAVVQLALSEPDGQRARQALATLASGAEADWTECVVRLDENRISALAYHALATHGALDAAPKAQRDFLQLRNRSAKRYNQMALLTLGGVARELAKRGVKPTVCKGALLCSHYYPDVGARQMLDVDLWIEPDGLPGAREVFTALGFKRDPNRSTLESDCFSNPVGVTFDVHGRMRLFEGRDVATRPLPWLAPDDAVRGFEPNALVAHLIVHLSGHLTELGPVLGWLLDLCFVMRRHSHEVDAARLNELIPERAQRLTLLRTLRFLEQTWGEPIPRPLAPLASTVRPYELESLLRQRRLASWELPRAKGWYTLAAYGIGRRELDGRHLPSWRDLVLWPYDRAGDLWEHSRAPRGGWMVLR